MLAGDLIAIPLPDGRYGGAQVLEVWPHAVALQIFGVVFDCAPAGPLDFQDVPVAVDHLPVAPARVVEPVVGRAPVPPVSEGRALWAAAGRRTVVDAPLPVLVASLLDA